MIHTAVLPLTLLLASQALLLSSYPKAKSGTALAMWSITTLVAPVVGPLLGVRYTPSVGNFLLIDTGRDCEEDFARLLHEGVIVRPMKLYAFPTSQRVTIGTHEENEQFLEALKRVSASPVRAAG